MSDPHPRDPRRWTALAVVLVAAFMDLLDVSIVSVALPAIAADLDASPASLQWTVAAYTLGLGAGLITGGRLGDQHGRRRMFLTGLVAFVLFSAACALAPSAGVLIAARGLQGLAVAVMLPQALAIIRVAFDDVERPKALGAYGAVLGLAAVAGPLLGGLLVDTDLFGLGWRAIFWVNVPVGLLGIAVGLAILPESRDTGARRLDLLGAGLGTTAVVLLLYPLVQGRELGWPAWVFGLMAAAVPVLLAFVMRLRRLTAAGGSPLLDLSLFGDRRFVAGLGAALLFFGAIGAFFLVLVVYLQNGTGRSALDSGLVLLPYALGSLLTSGLSVKLAARVGRALLVGGALMLAAANALLLFNVNASAGDPSYLQLAGPLLLGGLGLGLAAPPLTNVVLSAVDPRSAGAAAGLLNTVIQLGSATGVAVLGMVFFGALNGASPTAPAELFGSALVTTLPWQIGAYLLTASLMTLLPARSQSVPVPGRV